MKKRTDDPAGRDARGERAPGLELEGEGSYSGARRYDEEAEAHARSGRVDEAAREARAALDTPEEQAMKQAEEEGKRRAAEEDPELYEEGREDDRLDR
jgi:hypothetical protein